MKPLHPARLLCAGLALTLALGLGAPLPAAAQAGESGAPRAAESGTVLRVLCDADNYPFEWYDSRAGRLRGIDIDILDMIAGGSGLTFEYFSNNTLKDSWEAMKKGGADMIAGVYVDETLAARYNLRASARYTTEDSMGVARTGAQLHPDGDLTVAVKASFLGMQQFLRTTHPNWKQVTADDAYACLWMVERGRADVTFIDIASLQKSSPLFDFQHLTLLPELTVRLPIGLGISTRLDPTVAGRVNSAIAALDPAQLQEAVLRNTMADRTTFSLENFIRYHPWLVLLTVALLLGLAAATAALIYRARLKARSERQLQEKNLELQRANAAKSEFLSRMSHDIRTPLNGIIGMTRIAGAEPNPPRTADCLGKIDISSRFLLGLVNDILDMTKAESCRIELHPEPYPLEEFLSYLDAVIRPLCREKGVRFVADVPRQTQRDLPLADRLRFNQIFFNLLSNAVKYTPAGGTVTLLCDLQRRPGGLTLYARVEDTGVGISPGFLPHVFEAFTQEGRSDISADRGSGLGLAIVKKMVDLMGGTIAVQSTLGQGTAFDVALPLGLAGQAQPDDPPAPAGQKPLTGLRVLLCEDHPLNQEIATALLADRGVQVELAADGAEGARKFRQSAPGWYNAVLMDLRMPVMDGYEAARAIRALQRPDARNVPIIAMTADAFEEDVQKCRAAGMNGHVPKPVDPQELYRVLGSLCGTGA